MKSFSSREIIRILLSAGWEEVACVGDHHHFKHPIIPGRVTVPHPKKNIPAGTTRNIFRQAGIDLKGIIK
ncbi:MAG: type II toxin-antitoxin system HicA family toxin [Spirochaetia bacterium]|nr:type II toxin-antitoxin system HicA family toxin [Spirochaetia bacterium]